MIRGERRIGECPRLGEHIEVGHRRLDHYHVRTFSEIEPDLLHRFANISEVLLVGGTVAPADDGYVDRLAERSVERRGVLGGIRQDRHLGVTCEVEGGANCRHLTIHHPRGRHDVHAGLGLGDRNLGIAAQGGIVVDGPVGAQQAAVAVVGVLVEAEVGHELDLVAESLAQSAQRQLHDPVGVRSTRPGRILGRRHSEEDGRRHAHGDEFLDLDLDRGQIELGHPGQRRDRLRGIDSLPHEDRRDQVSGSEHRFGDESTQCGRAAQSTQPTLGEHRRNFRSDGRGCCGRHGRESREVRSEQRADDAMTTTYYSAWAIRPRDTS